MKKFTEEFRRRAESTHLPSGIAKAVLTEVLKWTEKSGHEWTVKRLKALKVDFIRYTAGLEPSSDWIKYCGSVPCGAFGSLFRLGKRDPKRIPGILQILSMYTYWVSRETTPDQQKKFYGSVTTEPLANGVVSELYNSLGISQVVEKLSVPKKRLMTVKDYVPSSSRRCPTVKGKTIVEDPPNDGLIHRGGKERGWLDTINVLWDTSLGRLLYRRYPQLRQVVMPIAETVEGKLRKLPPYFFEEGQSAAIRKEGFVGKIGEIQEPGLKLRAVANPFRVYQLALSRLGAQLYELLETLSWDVTHDQESGIAWAQRKLQSGHTMFAVDLSDATNVFPLELQLMVLKDLRGVVEEDINLFEDLSKAPWLTNSNELIRWTKGQPLGLFPSFASFALTHGILVRSLEIKLGLPEGDNFRILGDDIVISNADLNNLYREVLEKLQVPVSESKTLTSHAVTEFGGRVIYPDSIISSGKWREISDRSFIDLIKNIGPGYIRYLRPRQRKVIEKILTLPEPWGLNMNPAGVSALERHLLLEDFLDRLELDYPEYQKEAWTRSRFASVIASPTFRTKSLSEFIYQKGFSGVRQDTSVYLDPLVRIAKRTGVEIQPSLQFRDLAIPYTDILERVHDTAKALGLVTKRSSDPRGPSTLEIFERRLSALKTI